ncbi:Pre-mRNA-processing factor 17 [Heterocephalus glaber]|uniref:Pre-mRNA-processing factor 17 n=1 Tax=Heterocephalus glaber TaxID=10181 RepID=G5B0Y2_HETGA|nr:Pre-mRNA-processing factor 17 [Heterocephalus glaber]
MSAAIAALASSYGSGSGSESDSDSEGSRCPLPATDSRMHLTKSPSAKSSLAVAVDSAPEVAVKEDLETGVHLDPAVKEVQYNPTCETMFAPEFEPENPFRTQQMTAPRNVLSGYAEPAHINDFMFEQQRRTFVIYGYALDPSLDNHQVSAKYIGSVEEAEKNQGLTVFETGQKKTEKRKKFKENDTSNIDGFLGPGAKYVHEKDVAKPSEEEQKELDEITAKRQRKGKQKEKPGEEKTVLQVKEMYDYQGRSYLHIPLGIGINLQPTITATCSHQAVQRLHLRWISKANDTTVGKRTKLQGPVFIKRAIFY